MKRLKLKFKRKTLPESLVEEKETPKTKVLLGLQKTKIKKKQGRWCEYYEGRVPYPIECGTNRKHPRVCTHPNCLTCERSVSYRPWKNNIWDDVIERVSKGRQDLSDWPSPEDTMRDEDRF